MKDISRRLNTMEKRLRTGKHTELIPPPPVVVSNHGRDITTEDEIRLGLPETWITYNKQLQAQEKANIEYLKKNPRSLHKTIIIELDVDKEYQASQ